MPLIDREEEKDKSGKSPHDGESPKNDKKEQKNPDRETPPSEPPPSVYRPLRKGVVHEGGGSFPRWKPQEP